MNIKYISFIISSLSLIIVISCSQYGGDVSSGKSVSPSVEYYVAANDSGDEAKAIANYICDGQADELEINAALKYGQGKTIILTDGTYQIAGGIIVPSNTILTGQGLSTKIFRTTVRSGSALADSINNVTSIIHVTDGSVFFPGQTVCIDKESMYISSINGDKLTVIRGHNDSIATDHQKNAIITFKMEVIRNEYSQEGGANKITIKDLFIDGGSKIKDMRDSPGITLRKCTDSQVIGCWVQNVCSSYHPASADVDFIRGGAIQADNSSSISIRNCYTTGTSHAGISFRNNCVNCTADNNTIWDIGYEGIEIGNKTFLDFCTPETTGEGCRDITISNNNITNCGVLGGSVGIMVDDQATEGKGNSFSGIKLINNTIKQTNSNVKMSGIGIMKYPETTDAAWDYIVDSNIIEGCVYTGIQVKYIKGGQIIGNKFSNCGMSGISILYSGSMHIIDNICENNAAYGISIHDSDKLVIKGNVLLGNLKKDIINVSPNSKEIEID